MACFRVLVFFIFPKQLNITVSIVEINKIIGNHLEHMGFGLKRKKNRCPHILGAKITKNYTGNLVNELRNNNIYLNQGGNSIRFAPHLHIDDYDIDRLLNTLIKIIK